MIRSETTRCKKKWLCSSLRLDYYQRYSHASLVCESRRQTPRGLTTVRGRTPLAESKRFLHSSTKRSRLAS